MWNELTFWWNELTILGNDLTWNDLTMERNDRIPVHGTLRLIPVFISPIVWHMCEHLHYESVYFKELHKEQEHYKYTEREQL